MKTKRGSPAFGLGVFFIFCLSLPLFGAEDADPPSAPPPEKNVGYAFSQQGGALLVSRGRGSGFWAASLFLKNGPVYASAGAGGVFSDLPVLDADYTGARLGVGLDAAPLGFDISGGFFLRDTLNAEMPGASVESGGAGGYFLRLALPLRFGDWSAEPFFLYGQGFWEDGDLYWFFGKPSVPAFFAAGISAAFREEHRLYFRYFFLDLDILGPSGADLFASHFDGFAAAYRRNFRLGPFRLDAAAGWLSAGGGLDGSLNVGNQQYYLFPYLFYDANIDARLHALFGILQAEFRRGVFRLGLGIGAVQVLWGEIGARLHSKQKNQSYLGIPIFDGREEFYSRSVNPGGLGAAFLSVEGGLEKIALGRKKSAPALSLSVKKLFAVPWGYEKFLDSGFIDTDGGEDAQGPAGGGAGGGGFSIADILLSGLSLRCSITR